ncbi:dTDP-4-dehydrorhamnose reductase [Paenibacillus cremeus]|uniref:dTDP-4-dehydrorhamnose reductase n=1 Tax=Paenibacillus cremeus TaxID=2163881 RepID=A0A559KI67_9BACL|nr:dTDP-4-dehydrorhamnose reductase [Paenibacillus cremeus]TVY11821.1 dTDP-4-dehydrorhamnose reductase [Paenibacillus cremeus]
MKILITGAGGQLGRDLIRVLGQAHECIPMTRASLDVGDEAAVRACFESVRPDAVVHAAAFTQVDLAESHLEEAYRVNALGSYYVGLAAEAFGAKLVCVSTDYVFDGMKGSPYHEEDRTNPLSVYGRSKLLGEQFVQKVCPHHFIVRTSWLYGRGGNNFVTKVLALADRQQELTVVDDQFGSPTYTYDLAECIGRMLATERYDTYHVANSGYCSRWDFARAILELAGRTDVTARPITSQGFVLPAPRPQHSAFDDRGLRKNGFPPMRHWRSALGAFIHTDWKLEETEHETN